MISCSICNQRQMVGTVFCGNCGNQLVPGDNPNQEVQVQRNKAVSSNPSSLGKFSKKKRKESWISLYFLETGEILSLPDKEELTIGRCSENQPVLPDIDLSRFNAFENGVSRLHCVLSRVGAKPFVIDLGSSNGTTLNGIPLDANSDTAIKHGDILSLGKLTVKLLIHQ